MSVDGPRAMAAIEEALRDIRREEVDVTRRLARGAERIVKLRESESMLAGRAPATAAPERGAALATAVREAREALNEQVDRITETEAAVSALDGTIEALASRRAALVGEIGQLQGGLEAVAGRIAGELAHDPDHEARRREAEDAARLARMCIAKSNQADRDRETKGRAFLDDPLFRYLWQRGYATPGYRANALARRLDGLVARLVGYDGARANFVMVNELPLRLQEFAELQAERAANAEAALAAHVDAAVDAAGGAPIRSRLAALYREIAALDAEMVTAEDARDAHTRSQRALVEGQDSRFGAALAALNGLLAAAPAETPGAVPAQIESMRQRAEEEERDAAQLRERLRTLAARRRELEDLQYEFKAAHFDDPRALFVDDGLTGELLTEFLRGGITADRYWRHWQDAHGWQAGGPGSLPWRQPRGPHGAEPASGGGGSVARVAPAGPFTRPRARAGQPHAEATRTRA